MSVVHVRAAAIRRACRCQAYRVPVPREAPPARPRG